MQVHHDIVGEMIESAKVHQKTELRYGVTQITDFDANILYSTLLFDNPDGIATLGSVTIDGVKIHRVATFSRPAVTDWRNVEGESDREKAATLVADANARIDYLILPDKETAKRIAESHSHNVVNRHAVMIREMIVNDDAWVRVKGGMEAAENEFLEIYRNNRH